MKSILEPAKRIPVFGTYDVVVCGGGPAGIASAIASARNGAKTLLIEQGGALGGMGTLGEVPSFCPFGKGKRTAITGIGLEAVERLKKAGGLGVTADAIPWVVKDPEKLKVIYDEMVSESGAKLLFFTFVSGVIKQKDKISYVLIENKSGRQAVAAKIFIDATGDADVAAAAGCAFSKGDKRGIMQAASLCFRSIGIEKKKYYKFSRAIDARGGAKEWWASLVKKGKLAKIDKTEYRGLGSQEIYPGSLGHNFGHVYFADGTNAKDLTRVMVSGRKLAQSFVEYGRKHIPGMKNAKIVATGALPGIRETRRIKGAYELTLDDYLNARHFPDDIAVYDYTIDVHNATSNKKEAQKFDKDFYSLWLKKGQTYGISFRSLLPQGVSNLLVAGRSISSDRMMNGSVRVMPACFATGQAAGTAAALSAGEKTVPGKLDIRFLRQRLEKQVARIK